MMMMLLLLQVRRWQRSRTKTVEVDAAQHLSSRSLQPLNHVDGGVRQLAEHLVGPLGSDLRLYLAHVHRADRTLRCNAKHIHVERGQHRTEVVRGRHARRQHVERAREAQECEGRQRQRRRDGRRRRRRR